MIPLTRSPVPPRPWAVRLLGLASALFFVLFVATPWLWWDPPPATPTTPPATDEQQRARALIEARDNCLVAALLARGVQVEAPWFQTAELRRALETDLVERAAHGELPALREEARWLERRRRGLRSGRSWADVQLLAAAIHHYLLLASPDPVPPSAAHIDQPIDPAQLKEFKGLDLDDLLGTWD